MRGLAAFEHHELFVLHATSLRLYARLRMSFQSSDKLLWLCLGISAL